MDIIQRAGTISTNFEQPVALCIVGVYSMRCEMATTIHCPRRLRFAMFVVLLWQRSLTVCNVQRGLMPLRAAMLVTSLLQHSQTMCNVQRGLMPRHHRVFGTNPMAFGWPRPLTPPLVWDQASSAMARGEIELKVPGGSTVCSAPGCAMTEYRKSAGLL